MNKIIPIIFTGKAQSGKDTSANYIEEKLNKQYNIRFFSFADELKTFLIRVFGLTENQVYGSNEDKNTLTQVQWKNLPFDIENTYNLMVKLGVINRKIADKEINNYRSLIINQYGPNNPTPSLEMFLTARQLMQIFGTQICRKMFNNCWANACHAQMNSEGAEGIEIGLITDARFPNELDIYFNPKDFVDEAIVICLNRNPISLDHESETALDDYNFGKFKYFKEIDNTNCSLEEKNQMVLDFVKQSLYQQGAVR